jgi:formamidopyrimidine-DNA glycosylase
MHLSHEGIENCGPAVSNTRVITPYLHNLIKTRLNLFQNKFICDVLSDQQFFNGIGNFLRSEIIYRAGLYFL